MIKTKILFLIIGLTINQHVVQLILGTEESFKEDFLVDLYFERILIPEEMLDCQKISGCTIKKKNQTFYYHDITYHCDIIEIPLILENSANEKIQTSIEIDLITFSYNKFEKGVIGLAVNSVFKDAIKEDYKIIKYDPLEKNLILLNKEDISKVRRNDFDIKKYRATNKNVYYLDSFLKYKLEVEMSFQSEVINQASICFNDINNDTSNYFFKSQGYFDSDWITFFSYFESVNFGKIIENYLRFEVLPTDKSKDYKIPYDKDLFQAYSNYPMVVGSYSSLQEECDIFIGEFFLKRSGMKLYLENNKEDNNLKLSFSLDITSYEFSTKYYFKFFLILLLFASLISIIVLYFILKNKKKIQNNKEDYRSINSEKI